MSNIFPNLIKRVKLEQLRHSYWGGESTVISTVRTEQMNALISINNWKAESFNYENKPISSLIDNELVGNIEEVFLYIEGHQPSF